MTVDARVFGVFATLMLVACAATAAEPPSGKLSAEAARGRYLVANLRAAMTATRRVTPNPGARSRNRSG